jgi:hypothetical protein
VDLITVTKAQCASPMDYYASLLLTLFTFKLAVCIVILLAWALPIVMARWRALRAWLAVPAHLRSSTARRRRAPRSQSLKGRRRTSLLPVGMLRSTDWVKVGGASSAPSDPCCGLALLPSACTPRYPHPPTQYP